MLPLGLSHTEMEAYRAALCSAHSLNVKVAILDLDHETIANVGHLLVDGQVNGDVAAQVTRMCTMQMFDPDGALPIDSDSPADGALFFDRMVRVHYEVKTVGAEPVRVNVFTGPITKLDRSGSDVNIEASGKEILAQCASWEPRTIKKGTPKIDAIERIMRWAGETKFTLPTVSGNLNEPVSLAGTDLFWDVARRIAHSMNMQLFYDGDGVCRLRRHPGNAAWSFRDGNGGSLLTEPQVSYSVTEGLINAVRVKGGEKKTAKKKAASDPDTADPKKEKPNPVRYSTTAPRSHPLSPWRLGRKGSDGVIRPRFLMRKEENSKIRSKAKAKEIGDRILDHGLMQGTACTFDAMPIPHLDLGDIVHAATDAVNVRFRLGTFSLPMSTGDGSGNANPMTVGYQRNLSFKAHRRRHGLLPVVKPQS